MATASSEYVKKELGVPVAASQTEGKGVAFKVYPNLAHSANDEELADLKAWIKKVIPA
jgi:lysophospholipase I